ncbi:MAG: sec-independent protein translocase protein TatB [Halieaceae bacterium]|jgi:sec-independent protein translocase protein TatB
MFDIGFAELIIIGVVGLLVIGPERLPGAIRTASLWLRRIKRGFNDIRQEVEQEIHNDGIMQELKKTGDKLKEDVGAVNRDLKMAVSDGDVLSDDSAKIPKADPTKASNS